MKQRSRWPAGISIIAAALAAATFAHALSSSPVVGAAGVATLGLNHDTAEIWVSSTTVQPAPKPVFHGNVDSKIFHKPGCRHYTCKNCTAKFETKAAAVAAGYRACKVCKP